MPDVDVAQAQREQHKQELLRQCRKTQRRVKASKKRTRAFRQSVQPVVEKERKEAEKAEAQIATHQVELKRFDTAIQAL